MYLEQLNYKNVGPIKDLGLTFRKNEQGVPVPLVVVGKNGSGKSILLSNIVDAFYEMASIRYDNAVEPTINGHQYYKVISPHQITFGEPYMVAHICMHQGTEQIEYLLKSGQITFEAYQAMRGCPLDPKLDWGQESNHKIVTVDKKDVEEAFSKNVVCYFGPNRYMPPDWMGGKYFENQTEIGTFSTQSSDSRELKNPVAAKNISALTRQWLFDIIADSRSDVIQTNTGSLQIDLSEYVNTRLLTVTRDNVQKILSEILGEEVIFRMRNRSFGERRLSINKKIGNTIVANSLDALSTGQLSLFNLFATIIRYADTDNINLGFKLGEIEGIVIIDEIELHLHTRLQRETLPKLIALFPKVQFIITSHSPLFLLGMREQFGEDGFDVVELPTGKQISVEQYSEFESAYRYYADTERHRQEIKAEIEIRRDKPLIITEGATDWRHMKTALAHLKTDERYKWLQEMDFAFLQYEPENSTAENCIKLQMSGSQLVEMCEQYRLMEQPKKLIFIADADVPKVTKALSEPGKPFKSWGNHVYSLILPLPLHRAQTSEICIEHYYTDAEIRTELEIDGIKRRLYMGSEFDKDGLSLDQTLLCTDRNSCGPDRINIIDGHGDSRRVLRINDPQKANLALSKMRFAEAVQKGEAPFDRIDFSSFVCLFEVIRDILAD